MMFRGKKIFNASFDMFANDYHSVRPTYPVQLFKDIKDYCGIDSNAQMLEIGAGSGIATIELAKLGCHIVAVEPGAHLAMIAKRQTDKFENVKIYEGTFENFQAANKFDVILAFTAFHWLSSKDKYQQVYDLLNVSGSLVLVWNSFFQSNSIVTAEVNDAYRKFLPDVYSEKADINDVNNGVLSKLNRREQEVVGNPLFYPVFLKQYLNTYNYNDQTYSKLLNTFPKIIGAEEEKRKKFLEHISKIVKRHGKISVPVMTTLIICQRKKDFLEALANSEKGR